MAKLIPGQAHPDASPLPCEVPEYENAKAAGNLPVVPVTPPVLASGPTAQARHAMLQGIITGLPIGMVIAVGANSGTLNEDFTAFLKGTIITAAIYLALVAPFVWLLLRQAGNAHLRELGLGYTTSELRRGSFRRKKGSHSRAYVNQLPWDYSGVWRMIPGVAPIAPVLDVDPPGFYPSPHRPGMYELWTGAAWGDDYETLEGIPVRMGKNG